MSNTEGNICCDAPPGSPPLTLVVAMSDTGVIGHGGRLPWHLPQDLSLFKDLTLGGAVIMGRKTFESLPAPLDGRINLVVSRTLKTAPGRTLCADFPAAYALARHLQLSTYIIGGVDLYRQALPSCQQMVVSWVEGAPKGDVFFPEIEWSRWEERRMEQYSGFKRGFYERLG